MSTTTKEVEKLTDQELKDEMQEMVYIKPEDMTIEHHYRANALIDETEYRVFYKPKGLSRFQAKMILSFKGIKNFF